MGTRIKNRLFVSWQNGAGLDCKLIGPETQCMCQCRYKNHQTDVSDPDEAGARRLKCKRCPCVGFNYVYSQGPRQIKCGCKHDASVHDRSVKSAINARVKGSIRHTAAPVVKRTINIGWLLKQKASGKRRANQSATMFPTLQWAV